MTLSDRDATILDFERHGRATDGRFEQQVRDRFGLTITQYAQVLNRLLDDPEALAAEPLTVRRLRRIRDARAARVTSVSPQPGQPVRFRW